MHAARAAVQASAGLLPLKGMLALAGLAASLLTRHVHEYLPPQGASRALLTLVA